MDAIKLTSRISGRSMALLASPLQPGDEISQRARILARAQYGRDSPRFRLLSFPPARTRNHRPTGRQVSYTIIRGKADGKNISRRAFQTNRIRG